MSKMNYALVVHLYVIQLFNAKPLPQECNIFNFPIEAK